MKIIYICHYFPPEIGAPSARVYEMSRRWVEQGHEVHVITCFPNHPTGIIPEKYKNKKYMFEKIDGINVHRNYVFATPNKGFVKKTINHLSFMFSSVIFSLKKIKTADFVITSSPTFFSMFSGLVYSKFKRAKFVLEIRDLWPAAIIDLGVLKKGVISNLLEKTELYLYKKADHLVMVTESFKDNLVERRIDPEKISVITNGVDTKAFRPGKKSEKILKEHNLKDNFIVSYVGAHGISQNLKVILDVAKNLQKTNIKFLLIGDGAEKEMLKEYAAENSIKNVVFIDAQKKKQIPEYYKVSDISLVPLKDIDLFKTFIPSKIFEIMASGVPIVASVSGETANILKDSEAALVVEPESVEQIKNAILEIKSNSKLAASLANSGPDFVARKYSRNILADNYIKILERMNK